MEMRSSKHWVGKTRKQKRKKRRKRRKESPKEKKRKKGWRWKKVIAVSDSKRNLLKICTLTSKSDGLLLVVKSVWWGDYYWLINVWVLQKVHKERALPEPPVRQDLVSNNIKFRTSFRNCVYKALNNREWKETEADDWNVMWCEK